MKYTYKFRREARLPSSSPRLDTRRAATAHNAVTNEGQKMNSLQPRPASAPSRQNQSLPPRPPLHLPVAGSPRSPVIADEAVALGHAGVWVTHDLGRLGDEAEGGEGVVQHLLVNVGVQLADEQVRTHVIRLRCRRWWQRRVGNEGKNGRVKKCRLHLFGKNNIPTLEHRWCVRTVVRTSGTHRRNGADDETRMQHVT